MLPVLPSPYESAAKALRSLNSPKSRCSHGQQEVNSAHATFTRGPSEQGPFPASAACLTSSEIDPVAESYPNDSASETPLRRDLPVKPSQHGALRRGRSREQTPAWTGSAGEGGGSGGCGSDAQGAPAQRPLAPMGHAQPKATDNHLTARAGFHLVLFPSQACRISIAAQAAAWRVRVCSEKLKQQQLSFSHDQETGLKLKGCSAGSARL